MPSYLLFRDSLMVKRIYYANNNMYIISVIYYVIYCPEQTKLAIYLYII